jgi:four helix bundle protein
VVEAIRSYKDLKVWKMAIALAEAVYDVTSSFPRQEIFGMTAQLRRASVSIPSNIAEGYGRESTQSFIQFAHIAQGSLKELETQLVIAGRIRLLDDKTTVRLQDLCDSASKMLRNLIRSLEDKPKR